MYVNLKQTTISYYGTGGSWGGKGIYGEGNGNNNEFYIGRKDSKNYRSKLLISIPEDLDFTYLDKLVIRLDSYGQTLRPGRVRALLSNKKAASSNYADIAELDDFIVSYLYKQDGDNVYTRVLPDSDGKINSDEGNDYYFIFENLQNRNFNSENPMHIYILPYANDEDAIGAPTFSETSLEWRNNANANGAERLDAFLYYTKIEAPGDFTISSDRPRVKEMVTFSWTAPTLEEGITLSGYKLYYNNIETMLGASYIELGPEVNSYQSVASFEKYKKYDTINFFLQTKAEKDGETYYSTSSQVQYQIDNTPPTKPDFIISGVVPVSGDFRDITITKIICKDDDEDKISYHYSITRDQVNTIYLVKTVPFTIKCKKEDEIQIIASDGLKDVYSDRKEVPINSIPEITQFVPQFNIFSGFTKELLNIKCTASKQVQKYKLKLGVLTWEKSSLDEFKNLNLQYDGTTNIPNYGENINISLQVQDTLGDWSKEKKYSSSLKLLAPITKNNFTNFSISSSRKDGEENSESNDENIWIGSMITPSYEVDYDSKTNLPFNIQLMANKEGEAAIEIVQLPQDSNAIQSYSIEQLERNVDYNFYVKITDAAGQQWQSDSKTRKILPLVTFSSEEVTSNSWNIWEQSVKPFISANASSSLGEIYPHFQLKIGNVWMDLIQDNYWIEPSQSIEFSLVNDELTKDVLKNLENKKQEVLYRLFFENCFGDYLAQDVGETDYYIVKTIEIDTRSAPQIKDTKILSYFVGSGNVFVSSSYCHVGESIKLGWGDNIEEAGDTLGDQDADTTLYSLFKDNNIDFNMNQEKELVKIKAYISENEPSEESDSFDFLRELTSEEIDSKIIQIDSEWRPIGLGPKKVWLGFKAIDSTGLESAGYIYTNHIDLSRKTNSSVTITSVSREGNNLTCKYSIVDWGGNGKGWENFRRGNGEIITEVKIYCNSINDFSNIIGKDGFTLSDEKWELNLNDLDPSLSSAENLYIKAEITVKPTPELNLPSYNLSSTTPIFIFYGNPPTIAYRPNAVGINTASIEKEGAILEVHSHGNRNKIIFYSILGDSGVQFSDGTLPQLFGLIIDGGSWDDNS